jgi:bla regulator protein BlaR1
MGMTTLPGGRVSMKNVTLRLLIEMAWDLRDHQFIGAQGWLDTEHFDILAKPETEIPRTPEGRELQQRMIQTLVAERFGLVFHRETKEMPVYALVPAKNGPKLATSAPDTQASSLMNRGKLECKRTKTSVLAKMLASTLGRSVVDQTGLTGDYDFTMEWVPDMGESMGPKGLPEGPPKEAPQAPDGPSLFTAIQEQLGLKLESQKGPVEMFVIDRAARPSEN